ncbi:hypothetical protein GC170_14580 [bacterium]|nr:hypothetical protein [bacterium]
MHIDESTFLQLIESVKAHRGVITSVLARSGQLLTYSEMHVVNSGIDLERSGRTQAAQSGITPPMQPGAKS